MLISFGRGNRPYLGYEAQQTVGCSEENSCSEAASLFVIEDLDYVFRETIFDTWSLTPFANLIEQFRSCRTRFTL